MQQDTKQQRLDRAWLRAALTFALTMSKDPERKVGAAIVTPDSRRVSMGYNGFPMNVPDTEENWANKALKNDLCIHAEVNAVIKAPFDTAGSTCYCTLRPCHPCFGVLSNAQCPKVVCLDDGAPWAYRKGDVEQLIIGSADITIYTLQYTDVELGILRAFGHNEYADSIVSYLLSRT